MRQGVRAALDQAGIPYGLAVEGDGTRTFEASVGADLAVHTVLAGPESPNLERVSRGGALPELKRRKVTMHLADPAHGPAVLELAVLELAVLELAAQEMVGL